MNGNFMMGMALGALAGIVVSENKNQAKQFLQKAKQAANKTVTTLKDEMTSESGNSNQGE